jgi:muramoyltetrapeptide carboxypeptidase LdcA involved in peptidoglycan recycling
MRHDGFIKRCGSLCGLNISVKTNLYGWAGTAIQPCGGLSHGKHMLTIKLDIEHLEHLDRMLVHLKTCATTNIKVPAMLGAGQRQAIQRQMRNDP